MYVEWDDGRSWGWYEGGAIEELVEWLRGNAAQGITSKREQRLWRALKSCPTGPSFPTGAGAGRASVSDLLARQRPNGYAGLVAPILRGAHPSALTTHSLQLATVGTSQGGGSRGSDLHLRIDACCESLIGDVDVWLGWDVNDVGAAANGIWRELSSEERSDLCSRAGPGGAGLAPAEELPWAVRKAVEALEAFRVRSYAFLAII